MTPQLEPKPTGTEAEILNAVPDAVVVVRLDGTIEYINRQATELFGWNLADLIGKPVEVLIPARFGQQHLIHRASYVQVPRVRPMGADLDLYALHANGSEVPVEISLSPLTFGGEPAIISSIRNVGRRRTLERERERLLDEAQSLSSRLQSIQIVSDAALSELGTDALLAELLSRVRTVLRSDTAVILLADELGQQLVARGALGLEEEVQQGVHVPIGAGFAGRVAETRQPVSIEDIDDADIANPLLRVRGVRSLLGVPLLLEGRVLGVLHVGSLTRRTFTDAETELLQLVADRVALALDHARLYETAQEAIRLRNDFLSAISHDLGNPVAAIRMQSHLMWAGLSVAAAAREAAQATQPTEPAKPAPSTDELVDGLAQIEETARHAWRLIEELLDLARLQVGRNLDLNWCPIDLVDVVRRAVAAQQAATSEHQIQLDVSAETVTGEWDATRIERVVGNLLSNAVKYSPDGGEIVVRVYEEKPPETTGHWAVLQVQDSGIGIPAADLPHIFERFRRASNVVGRFSGTGIGLAGAKEIAEHHGGELRLESTEGAGTCVTMRLPLEDPP